MAPKINNEDQCGQLRSAILNTISESLINYTHSIAENEKKIFYVKFLIFLRIS